MKGETETVKLKTEGVTAYGEPLTELKLREPTGEDLAKCGFPFSFKISGRGSGDVNQHRRNRETYFAMCEHSDSHGQAVTDGGHNAMLCDFFEFFRRCEVVRNAGETGGELGGGGIMRLIVRVALRVGERPLKLAAEPVSVLECFAREAIALSEEERGGN